MAASMTDTSEIQEKARIEKTDLILTIMKEK